MKNIRDKKKLLTEALNTSFVDDYNTYKIIIDTINNDFKELNIDYEWSYDQFCVDFLNKSINNLDHIDIFSHGNLNDFYKNFWKFNLIVIKEIIINKFDELGYDYNEFENLLNKQKYINPFSDS